MEASSANEESTKSAFTRKLVCVNYPGIVNNLDNMIATIGGMDQLQLAVANLNKRLELRFRDKDIFCKPSFADKDTKAGLLIKIKVSSPKGKKVLDESDYSYEVIGVSTLTFKFNRFCDFQYLPLVSKDKETANTPLEYILNQLYPSNLPIFSEALVKGTLDTIPFLPPLQFLRNDIMQNKLYFERSNFYEGPYAQPNARSNKERAEKRRAEYERNKNKARGSIFFNFKEKSVPTKPPSAIQDAIDMKTISPLKYEQIKEYFKERPIWAKAALQHMLGVRNESMKALLPAVAYHHHSGPWRVMWVKYGYDPREDPNSRKYQTFDFRLRTIGGIKYLIKPKRSRMDRETDFKNPLPTSSRSYNTSIDENHYIFKPNVMPHARQMFYQYCDLQIPEIQAMISKLPAVPPGAKCHPKNGWLPSSFAEHCREILCKYVVTMVQAQMLKQQMEDKTAQPSTSSSAAEDKEENQQSFGDTFDLLEISDTDEETEDEFDEFELSDVEKMKDEDAESDENEIDMEAVEEVNRLIHDSKGEEPDGGADLVSPFEFANMPYLKAGSDSD